MRPTPGKDLSVDTGDTGPTPSTSDPTLAPEVRYMAALNYIQNIAPKQPYTLIIQNDNALDTAYGECESAEAPHIYVIANYLAKLTMPGCSTAQDSATQAICAQQYRACAVDGMDPACTDNGTAFGNSNFNGKSYYELASFQAASCATQAEGVGPSGSLTTGGDVNGGTEEMKNCSNRGDKWYKDWGEGEAMFAKAIEGLKTVRKECWNTHNWLGPLKVITGDASGTPQTTTKSLAQCTTATEPVKKVKAAREDKGGKKDAGAPPAVQVRADNDNALPVGVPVAADEAVVVPAMYRR